MNDPVLMPRHLNWRPDPSHAALPVHTPLLLGGPVPMSTDLEPDSPPAYDQGRMGSCTANAWCGVFEIKERVDGHDFGTPARLFFYQMELLLQGTWGQDAGSTIPVGARAALAFGLPPEKDYLYNDDPAALAVRPPHLIFALGRQRRATAAMEAQVQLDHDHIVAMLAAKNPLAAGFFVPQSFMSTEVARSGIWAGPTPNDPIVGGHAIAIVGHDDERGLYKIRNSWSPQWGANGHVWVPAAFVETQFHDLTAVVDAPK